MHAISFVSLLLLLLSLFTSLYKLPTPHTQGLPRESVNLSKEAVVSLIASCTATIRGPMEQLRQLCPDITCKAVLRFTERGMRPLKKKLRSKKVLLLFEIF